MPVKKTRRSTSDRADSLQLYRAMLKIRLAEQRIIELYPSDKIQSPIHLSIGQEAVSAGLCLGLGPEDHLFGTYRGHGLYIARGAELGALFAELYGKAAGCARGKGGSMHLTAPEVGLMGCTAIVGGTIPVATGDALASRMKGRPYVVASVFGDGGLDEGVFFESVNFAVLKDLPIMFVCENNGYAIHSRVADRHKQTRLCRIGAGLGLKGKRLDGNDVFAVHAAVRREAAALRRGGPPVLLEFMTHRWLEHVGICADFHEPYRLPREEKRAHKNDPLLLARAVLKKRFAVTDAEFSSWETQTREEVAAAVDFAERSPFPAPDRLYADLFAPV